MRANIVQKSDCMSSHHQRRCSGLLLACAAALTACESLVGLPSDAVPMSPPAIYARWWAMVEGCSGMTGDLGAVHWYRVPGAVVHYSGSEASGLYIPYGNRIVVSDSLADNGAGVRHEMLHALIRVGGHPRAEFLGACASLVHCEQNCAADAGPWSAPQPYGQLAADSLTVTATAELLPLESDGQRWVALRVAASNPRASAVMVVPAGLHVTWSSHAIASSIGGFDDLLPLADSSQAFFLPRQTKEWLWEFRVAPGLTLYTLPPGDYVMAGGFGQHWSAGTMLHVTQ